jgi:WD40 repeat protein
VFPWVLSDYTSEILDLDDPHVYRDLTKPVGALNPQRLSRLEERLESWEDDRIPAFLYGTHYSTMAFVLHWMVRVEPFTTAHIHFHDGVFDQGSRMFTSIHQSWQNVCSDSANVKELIPELFYLPEMLTNHNNFYLGREGACEDGSVIGDVILPAWADSSHEFIHMHREALESEYVSSNLHHWIDLIFGYKQRGEEAVKAKNTFYYLTYNGSIDLDTASDPNMRKGLEDQIRHFGQTPYQLLTDPHPQRDPAVTENPPAPIQGVFPHDPAVVAELQVSPDVPIGLAQLSTPPTANSPSSVLVVTYNQLYAISKWTVIPGKSNNSQVSLDPDPRIASGLKVRLGDPLDQSLSPSAACFAALPSNDVIFVCGFWDNSFKCFNVDTGTSSQSVFGHREIVTCIAFSGERGVWSVPGSGLLATGSRDATILVWRWCGRHRRVVGSFSGLQNRSSVVPEAILTGHVESVVCVDISASLALVISGAKHGNCLVHNTSGELLHKLVPACNWSFPHLITLTNRGHIVVHYADQKGCISVFSCNGQQLTQCALGDPALAMTVSRCGRYLVAGGFDCKVRVFLCHSLERNYVYEAFNSSIRSLHFSNDQR